MTSILCLKIPLQIEFLLPKCTYMSHHSTFQNKYFWCTNTREFYLILMGRWKKMHKVGHLENQKVVKKIPEIWSGSIFFLMLHFFKSMHLRGIQHFVFFKCFHIDQISTKPKQKLFLSWKKYLKTPKSFFSEAWENFLDTFVDPCRKFDLCNMLENLLRSKCQSFNRIRMTTKMCHYLNKKKSEQKWLPI